MRLLSIGNPVGRAQVLSTYNRSGPDNVTSTTSTEVPAFIQPALSQAVNAASGQLGTTDPNVANIRQGTGLTNLFERGQGGSPLVDDAQDLTGQTIRGDFLSPDSNPFLQQTFDRASELTRGRLDSEFSGAGRNLSAARPARSEELQTLSSDIFGGNFQRERDRQQNAVNQSLPLAQNDFADIQAQIDSGSFNIDQFINRLGTLIPGAGGTTRSTQPVFRTGLF